MSSGDHQARLRAEYDRSHAHLKRYHEKNPHVLSDPETYLQAHGLCTDAQLADLRSAGAPLSANPTATEIHDAHLHMRAHAPHRVRSADRLIDDVHSQLHGQPRRADGTFAPHHR
jgi:hypothetical protein